MSAAHTNSNRTANDQQQLLAIIALGKDGKPVGYLQYDPAWQPDRRYQLTRDRSQARRFGDKQSAEESADVMIAASAGGPELEVIEIDCDGPPLTVPPPPALQ